MFPVARVTAISLYKGHITNLIRNAHNQSSRNYIQSVQKYVFSSFFEFVKNYESKIELKFPAAIRVYRVFKVGIQDLFTDMKEFLKIIRKINVHDKNLESLTRKELELYFRMPHEMFRVGPVLLISALPFANYVIFPLAYFFPRHLLSSHFWSLQQRIEFAVLDQKHKLKYYKPVFRSLQAKLHLLKRDPHFSNWARCIALLGSGLHPKPETLTQCIHLFGYGQIYHIQNLGSVHVHNLLKMHNMYGIWRTRKRLSERAKIIQLMDRAILKEGGVGSLNHDEIRMACFLRGLNPTSMNSDETVSWLTLWVEQSSNVPHDCSSFILHLPILMAYNHPSNWVLIH